MVKTVLFFTLILSFNYGQSPDTTGEANPWENPLFVQAQEGGLHSLGMKEYPTYFKLLYRSIGTKEGRAALSRYDAARMDREYDRSKSFHGWTVSCSMVTGLIVIMFYIEKLF